MPEREVPRADTDQNRYQDEQHAGDSTRFAAQRRMLKGFILDWFFRHKL
jgi:hypothetical protein